jgi:hypothetical protein
LYVLGLTRDGIINSFLELRILGLNGELDDAAGLAFGGEFHACAFLPLMVRYVNGSDSIPGRMQIACGRPDDLGQTGAPFPASQYPGSSGNAQQNDRTTGHVISRKV